MAGNGYECKYNEKEKAKDKRKRAEKRWKTSIYKIWIILIIMCYFLTYYMFEKNQIFQCLFSAEGRMGREVWLSFTGSYLAFAGTLIVCKLTLSQSKEFFQKEKNREEKKRWREIQPVFSVEFEYNDTCFSDKSKPQLGQIILYITNVGNYPIRNIVVFDKYERSLMKSNEQIDIIVTDMMDEYKEMNSSENMDSDAERKLPRWFNINYEDIDGNIVFQTFELDDANDSASTTCYFFKDMQYVADGETVKFV